MIRARGVVVASVLVLACGQVSSGVGAAAARNLCSESPCFAYTQTGSVPTCTPSNLCQALNRLDFTLVVTMPDSSVYAPGHTFVQKYLKLTKTGTRCPVGETCLRLPSLGEFAGSYTASAQVAKTAGFFLGEGRRSLPVQATFRPAWTFVEGATQIDASLLGMELQPIIATPVLNDQPQFPSPSVIDSATQPAPSVGFDVSLPLTTDATALATTPYDGQFEETLAPTSPFEGAFAPAIVQGAKPLPGPLAKRDQTDFKNVFSGDPGFPTPAAHPVTVTRGAGLTLEGWTLYLRDERTLRRISSLATLQGPDVVSLFTYDQAAPGSTTTDTIRDGVELVLSPPPGPPRLPDLVLSALANRVPAVAPYPVLPPLVLVQGLVAAADGTAVRSDVVIVSDGISMLDSDLSPTDLRFVDQFRTNDDGTYERVLPPGQYKAILTPVQTSGYAKTIADLAVAVPTRPGDTTQGGKKLEVVQPVLIRGSVAATDGRALANAEVEAHASSSLLYATDAVNRDKKRWPRTIRTHTDASGDFVLPVDPGGMFDIVVRPEAGTNFPWTVIPQVTVPTPSDLRIQVPVPYVVSVALHDPGDNPVGDALVQAFVGISAPLPAQACDGNNGDLRAQQMCPATAPLCDTGTGHCLPLVAVEVGRARTDAAGRFVLFLDGRPR